MTICCVVGCSTRPGYKKDKTITLHKFPKKAEIKMKWIINVRRKDWMPSRYSVVCSHHFEENCFNRAGKIVTLKKGSVPTVFPTHPSYYQISYGRKRQCIRNENSVKNCLENGNSVETPLDIENSVETLFQEEKSSETSLENENSFETSLKNENCSETSLKNKSHVETLLEDENSVETLLEDENSVETLLENENSVETLLENKNSVETLLENENSVETFLENQNSVENLISKIKNLEKQLRHKTFLHMEATNQINKLERQRQKHLKEKADLCNVLKKLKQKNFTPEDKRDILAKFTKPHKELLHLLMTKW